MSAASKEREQQLEIEKRLHSIFKSYGFAMVKSKFEIVGKKKHGFKHFQRWQNANGAINYQHTWTPSFNQYSCNCTWDSWNYKQTARLVDYKLPSAPFESVEEDLKRNLYALLDP
jgi:hypothetical protein